MNSTWSYSQRAITAPLLRRYAIHSLTRRKWGQIRLNSNDGNLNGWKALSLNDYKTMIKNSKGSVLFDAKDPNQKRQPLVAPSRPTDHPYNNEIQASHVKLISQDGKVLHTSALLKSVLADIRAQNAENERPADHLILVQVAGLAYIPPEQANPEPAAESVKGRRVFSKTPRPPWRQNPPTCRLFTREELRCMAKEEEKQIREVEKKKRSGKEIETSWTVSPQDMVYVCRRLEEFLNEGRPVSVIIKRTKKWKVPSQEEVERTLSELRATVGRVAGAFEENCDGNPGSSMILDFKVRNDAGGESGQWQGLMPDKIIRLSWQIREKQLEAHIKEMRQCLRKGKHIAFKIESEGEESAKLKSSMTPKQIISQIRLAAGTVKDAVEIIPKLTEIATEESACENQAPWELRFEANSKRRNGHRKITVNSEDSTKQINLKLDWAKAYLDDGLQTKAYVHPDQIEAVKQLFEQRGFETEELEMTDEYPVFEVRKHLDASIEDLPLQPFSFAIGQNGRTQPPSKQARQNSTNAIDSLLELCGDASRQASGPQ